MTPPTIPAVLDAATARSLRAAAKRHDDAVANRDELIRQALANGGSAREIADLVGLSHTWVLKIGKGRT